MSDRDPGAASRLGWNPADRNRQLHHYARGLLARQRVDLITAEREFRLAAWSLTGGYSRINYELARTLLELGKPGEAIVVLKGALLAGPESNGTYLSRTELYLLLGRAYARSGRPDSAAAAFRWVINAWQRAEGEFTGRRDSVLAELASLPGH